MTMDDYVRAYIAQKRDAQAQQIVSFRFEASPGYQYSTYTGEDFSTDLWYTLADGTTGVIYLDQDDVVDFLNGFAATL